MSVDIESSDAEQAVVLVNGTTKFLYRDVNGTIGRVPMSGDEWDDTGISESTKMAAAHLAIQAIRSKQKRARKEAERKAREPTFLFN